MTELCEVVITAPDRDWLRRFASELIDRRLCSSVRNFTPVHSIYR
jgi:periplasmic divalent cation tolerance protein